MKNLRASCSRDVVSLTTWFVKGHRGVAPRYDVAARRKGPQQSKLALPTGSWASEGIFLGRGVTSGFSQRFFYGSTRWRNYVFPFEAKRTTFAEIFKIEGEPWHGTPFRCPCLGVSSVCLLTVPFERTLFSNSPPDTLRCKLHCYFVSCLKTVHISFLLIALQYCWPGDDGKICKTPERSQRGEFWPNTKRDDPRSPFRTHRPNWSKHLWWLASALPMSKRSVSHTTPTLTAVD